MEFVLSQEYIIKTHLANNTLIHGRFSFSSDGSNNVRGLFMMLIHSISCCSALMFTSGLAVYQALMSFCVRALFLGLRAAGNVHRCSPVELL